MKTILIFLFISTYLFGAPAYNKLREFKQADGTTFLAKGQGNHHLNWLETQDGDILRYNNESKNFDYATIEDSELKASGEKFKKQNLRRAQSLQQANRINKESIYELWNQKREKAKSKRALKN